MSRASSFAVFAVAAVAAVAGCSALAAPAAPAPRVTDLTPAAPAPSPDPMTEASLVADLAWLAAPERAGRGSTSPDARATARWLAGELRAAGYAPVEQPIPDVPGQVNVIAAAPAPASSSSPAAAASPAVLVVAHYDHLGVRNGAIHPGADDNASGVAVALAVARDLRRRPVSGHVVFLFTGAEEIGLRGARAFAAAPSPPLAELRAVYNLDMVGRELLSDTGAPQLAAVGLAADPDLTGAALDAAAGAGLTLAPAPAGLLSAIGQANRSDDWVFRDAGVFAVHFSTGLGDDYHAPGDTPDKVSRPQLLRVARFLGDLLQRTSRTPGR
jgi:Zn-dependent M28 family amino/carboxypeptidase